MRLSLPATGVDALPIGTLTTRVLLHPDQRFCTQFANTSKPLQNYANLGWLAELGAVAKAYCDEKCKTNLEGFKQLQ